MDNMQQVPIEVAIVTLRDTISKAINDCNMPMCIVTPIIKDVLSECAAIQEEQTKKAFEVVKEAQAKAEDEDATDEEDVEKVDCEVVD